MNTKSNTSIELMNFEKVLHNMISITEKINEKTFYFPKKEKKNKLI
jgi:hypothetical protein